MERMILRLSSLKPVWRTKVATRKERAQLPPLLSISAIWKKERGYGLMMPLSISAINFSLVASLHCFTRITLTSCQAVRRVTRFLHHNAYEKGIRKPYLPTLRRFAKE